MSSRRLSIVFAMLFLGCGMLGNPDLAHGSQKEAVAKYKQGRSLIEKKDYEAALRLLTESYALLDSPNTLLLMAHAERELGRESNAAALYERVVEESEKRVEQGEHRFAKTGEDARGWLDRLSQRLGKLTITVPNAPEGTQVRVDGELVESHAEEDGVKVEVWWKAGRVQVEATAPDVESSTTSVKILAGEFVSSVLEFTFIDETESSTDMETLSLQDVERGGKSVPTASWITGGIGLAGMATFAVFGSMAKSKADELDGCAPRCPESDRDLADAGKRDQTIANIGLIVGGVGLVSAFGFYVFQSSEPEKGSVDLAVAPNGLLLRGSFH